MKMNGAVVLLTAEEVQHVHELANKFLKECADAKRPRGARRAMRRLVAAQFAVARHLGGRAPTRPEIVETPRGVLRVIVVTPTEPGLPIIEGEWATEAGYITVTAHSETQHYIDSPRRVSVVDDDAEASGGFWR
jgi:hypothetical protein